MRILSFKPLREWGSQHCFDRVVMFSCTGWAQHKCVMHLQWRINPKGMLASSLHNGWTWVTSSPEGQRPARGWQAPRLRKSLCLHHFTQLFCSFFSLFLLPTIPVIDRVAPPALLTENKERRYIGVPRNVTLFAHRVF